MTFYDDTLESFIKRQKNGNKKKENEEKKEEAIREVIKKINRGLTVDATTYFSINEAKASIKKLNDKRKKIMDVIVNQSEISILCIQLNMSFDEIISLYQQKTDKINLEIHRIKLAFSPISLE